MPNPTTDIALQIMWNRLIAVVEEQAQTLLRTAFSSIVREAGDLSAGSSTARVACSRRP
jgi:N-methylhydantoinase B